MTKRIAVHEVRSREHGSKAERRARADERELLERIAAISYRALASMDFFENAAQKERQRDPVSGSALFNAETQFLQGDPHNRTRRSPRASDAVTATELVAQSLLVCRDPIAESRRSFRWSAMTSLCRQ